MSADKETKDKLITAYEGLKDIPPQEQNLPGLDTKLDPEPSWSQLEAWDENGKPYLREYKGSEKLTGKTALITGGDSGIGRSAAVMMAREGCDVTIVYLPQEEEE